jgi:hypothetical protein
MDVIDVFDKNFLLFFGTIYMMMNFSEISLYIIHALWIVSLTVLATIVLTAILEILKKMEMIIELGVNKFFDWIGIR